MGYRNIEKNCKYCGKTFFATKHQVKIGQGIFCSQKCSNENKKIKYLADNNPTWKNGISQDSYHWKVLHKNRHPEKVKARQSVTDALRRGNLLRMPCEICGEIKSEAHHEDYNKQLSVKWLCRVHHKEIHK